jgi:alkanesulfonate monooxygenase SsuD/methylene tetrahydromethanopterin reductase-like flavin-dependent oxidoreductase (luciferase family)
MKMSPAPTRPVPIIVGGHARVALARAAKFDGWISANTDFETLRTLIGQLNELRAQQGTDKRSDYEIHAYDKDAQTLDDFRRLRDLGVTDICATPWNVYQPTLSLQDKLDNLRRFGDEVIAKY